MVCSRCKMVVKQQLEGLNLQPVSINLGEVDIIENEIAPEKKTLLNNNLIRYGFELIDDKKSRLIEQIKSTIIEKVHYSEETINTNFSNYLSGKLNHDYSYLSNLFSETVGVTIEKYFIAQKIEKVKELLMYDELSISDIAIKLNYSSVAYLSNQFKKVTGLSPSFYKALKDNRRIEIEKL